MKLRNVIATALLLILALAVGCSSDAPKQPEASGPKTRRDANGTSRFLQSFYRRS